MHGHMKHAIDAKYESLSAREREILYCIAEGMSSKEIAERLFVSKNTIDTHRRNMIRKKRAKNCAQLILMAI